MTHFTHVFSQLQHICSSSVAATDQSAKSRITKIFHLILTFGHDLKFCGKLWQISVSLTSFMAYQWGNFAVQLFVLDIPRITCWSHSSVFNIWRRWRLEIQVDHPTHLLKAFGVLCGFKSICLLWQVVAPNISVHYPCMPTWLKWQIPCKIVCFNAHAKQPRHWKLYFLQGLLETFWLKS